MPFTSALWSFFVRARSETWVTGASSLTVGGGPGLGVALVALAVRSAEVVVPAKSVDGLLTGTGSGVGELTLAVLVSVPGAMWTVSVKLVEPFRARGAAWTQVTVWPGAAQLQPLPVPLTNVSPAGSGTGSATSFQLIVAVASGATGTLTNQASVTGGTPDPNPANNTAKDPTPILASADLAITKLHNGTFIAGQDGTYSISVVNNGPSDAAAP